MIKRSRVGGRGRSKRALVAGSVQTVALKGAVAGEVGSGGAGSDMNTAVFMRAVGWLKGFLQAEGATELAADDIALFGNGGGHGAHDLSVFEDYTIKRKTTQHKEDEQT